MARKYKKKKLKKAPPSGIVHVQSSFNNTIVTVTDREGRVLAWSSSGQCGFKGTKKGTPFAAQMAAQQVGKQVRDLGMKDVSVEVKGPGPGRDAAIRALQVVGLQVRAIKDVTPIPHNGCRPRKKRRV